MSDRLSGLGDIFGRFGRGRGGVSRISAIRRIRASRT
jgi:hypothetical protein